MIAQNTDARKATQFLLSGQPIPMNEEARYLGVLISRTGFSKETDTELEGKCVASCEGTINQPFFDADLPNSALRTLYRTNLRSIISYGLMLTTDINAMEKLDRNLLSLYFKHIVQHKRNIVDRLIDRLCLRLRLPSLAIDIESDIKSWS